MEVAGYAHAEEEQTEEVIKTQLKESGVRRKKVVLFRRGGAIIEVFFSFFFSVRERVQVKDTNKEKRL